MADMTVRQWRKHFLDYPHLGMAELRKVRELKQRNVILRKGELNCLEAFALIQDEIRRGKL
jgi:hypothetical protein